MVVAVDIGNTNTHCGIYHGERLRVQLIHPHKTAAFEEQIKFRLKKMDIEGVAIASVLPSRTRQIARTFRRITNKKPLIVETKCRHPLQMRYTTLHTLGVDRLANAVGAYVRYHSDVIVVGMGTAITIDVVLRDGVYCGGIIAPGMDMSFHSLATMTAQLPEVAIKKPRQVVGRNTTECIQSGIVNGTIAMLKGLIMDITHEYSRRFFVIATGGGSRLIANSLSVHYDPTLTLYGILKLYHYNTVSDDDA